MPEEKLTPENHAKIGIHGGKVPKRTLMNNPIKPPILTTRNIPGTNYYVVPDVFIREDLATKAFANLIDELGLNKPASKSKSDSK